MKTFFNIFVGIFYPKTLANTVNTNNNLLTPFLVVATSPVIYYLLTFSRQLGYAYRTFTDNQLSYAEMANSATKLVIKLIVQQTIQVALSTLVLGLVVHGLITIADTEDGIKMRKSLSTVFNSSCVIAFVYYVSAVIILVDNASTINLNLSLFDFVQKVLPFYEIDSYIQGILRVFSIQRLWVYFLIGYVINKNILHNMKRTIVVIITMIILRIMLEIILVYFQNALSSVGLLGSMFGDLLPYSGPFESSSQKPQPNEPTGSIFSNINLL